MKELSVATIAKKDMTECFIAQYVLIVLAIDIFARCTRCTRCTISFTSCYRESGFGFYVNDLDIRAFVIVG